MNLFGRNKKDTGEDSYKPVVSDKTKSSASFLKRTVSKIGDALHKRFGSTTTTIHGESMGNAEYLGEIYKLMVQNETDKKLDHEKENNRKRESSSEEKTRHTEIIKALTLKRKPKPKRVIQGPKKKEQPAKPGEPAKPAEAPKPPEVPKKVEAPKPPEVPKKVEAPKQAEVPKKAEVVKKETAPAPTATQKPPAPATTAATSTATKTGIGTGIALATTAALTGKEALASNIAKYESKSSSGKSFGGNEYNAYNKGTVEDKIIGADKPIDFSKMTIHEYFNRAAKTKQFPQGNSNLKPGDSETLFAVGRYQIIPPTMLNLVQKLKIDPKTTYLDPSTQDLLFAKGLTTSVGGRAAVDDYIKGKPDATRDAAIMALAKEFASVGVPFDTKRGDIPIKKGDSYYSGLGGNKAHNPPGEVGAALDADREKNLKISSSPKDIPKNVGETINQSSITNKDMKVQDRPPVQPIQQTFVNNTNTSEITTSPTVNDRPPLSGRK